MKKSKSNFYIFYNRMKIFFITNTKPFGVPILTSKILSKIDMIEPVALMLTISKTTEEIPRRKTTL